MLFRFRDIADPFVGLAEFLFDLRLHIGLRRGWLYLHQRLNDIGPRREFGPEVGLHDAAAQERVLVIWPYLANQPEVRPRFREKVELRRRGGVMPFSPP